MELRYVTIRNDSGNCGPARIQFRHHESMEWEDLPVVTLKRCPTCKGSEYVDCSWTGKDGTVYKDECPCPDCEKGYVEVY